MTAQELSQKYGISENSILTNFPRAQKSIIKKYQIKIEKEGRGQAATYLEIPLVNDRAMSMYEETKDNFALDSASFALTSADFCCLVAIILTPMMVFRGSFKDFCHYMQINDSKENIAAIKEALTRLDSQDYINFVIDKTDNNYFAAILYRKAEQDMQVGIDMVKNCKKIADEHNKRSWVPLLKTWLGVQLAAENQPFTIAKLEAITGLSKYQITESKKLLESNDMFKTSKAYKSYCRCVGQNVDLNAFYN